MKASFSLVITFGLVVVNCLVLYKLSISAGLFGGGTQLIDFDAYYRLTDEIKLGHNPYTVSATRTLGPPSVIIPFIPFAFFPIHLARQLLIALNLAAGLALSWQLARRLFRKQSLTAFLILNVIFWSAFVSRYSLLMGQPNIFLTWLLTLFLTTKNHSLQGVLLGFLTLFKTYFILLWLAFRRFPQVIKIALVTFVGVIMILSPVLKPAWYQYYLINRLPKLFTTVPIPQDLDYYNQSIKATVARFNVPTLYLPLYILITAPLVVKVIRTKNVYLAVTVSLLASPVIWQYYLVFLFPVLVYLSSRKISLPQKLLLAAAWLLWWLNFPVLNQLPKTLWSSLLASHYLISLLLIAFLTSKTQNTTRIDRNQF